LNSEGHDLGVICVSKLCSSIFTLRKMYFSLHGLKTATDRNRYHQTLA